MNVRDICGAAGTRSLGVCVLVLAATMAASAQSTSVVARAAGVTGAATLLAPSAAPVALTPGYILSPGDRIDTRGGGRVVVELSDGSMVVVSPGSLVTLKDFRAAASLRELFEITLGMVRVKINHFAGKPNPYRMNSPTASIAVRGTEFTIEVDASGATNVVVIEGAVQVTSLADPARSVILQAGQSFRLIAGLAPAPAGRGDDRRDGPPPPPNNLAAQAHAPDGRPEGPPPAGAMMPQPPPAQPPQQQQQNKGAWAVRNDHERDETSPRANASTYDRYLASLADIGQVPFLLRYNAFPEAHLDALENPAYATTFRSAEGRVFFLPTFHGGQALLENQAAFGPGGALPSDYSVSPQISFFAPAGGFTFGGSAAFSRVGSNSLSSNPATEPGMFDHYPGGSTGQTSGSSSTNFYSGSLVAARRFGRNSFGVEAASLKGNGTLSSTTTESADHGHNSTEFLRAASDVSQTRLTAGYTRDLSARSTFGLYYRYAFIDANDRDTAHTVDNFSPGLNATRTVGHSSEIGMRLRGSITPRLYYGLAASWLGVSLLDGLARINTTDSHERDRAHRSSAALGFGYSLTRRTVLTFDFAGGTSRNTALRNEDATSRLLENAHAANRFVSLHGAVQRDLTRRLFLTGSFLQVWQSGDLALSLFPDRFGNVVGVSDSFFPLASSAVRASRFSDFGAGWRFAPGLFAQYLYSTDYGATPATHTLMLRYTLGKSR